MIPGTLLKKLSLLKDFGAIIANVVGSASFSFLNRGKREVIPYTSGNSYTFRGLMRTIYRTMALFKRQAVLFVACLTIIAVKYTTGSPDDCYQYRRKANVTIDTDQCLWQNYTEPVRTEN